ncbi:hypothetical protein LCGC14_0414190 [marine sediment metagenome]|uniref:Uncharacterized protein n=1 Tax=marine sediment metagenome TaxID=412755 RepID=A0A0F9W231_9ZZZZ
MAAIVDICNRALSHVGRPSVSAVFPSDGSAEANQCNTHYNPLRRELLRSEEWKFATTTVTLGLHAEDPPPGWSYRYDYPADCLKAMRIVHASRAKTEPPIEFDIELLADGSAKTILTDFEEASLAFIWNLENPVLFDPIFEEAFTWRLGMELAVPLTRNEKIYQLCVTGYTISMSNAKVQNRNEGIPGRKPRAGAIAAR